MIFKETNKLPTNIKKILFYINNNHWSNNLNIDRLMLNNKITRKYLEQLSPNIEDHRQVIELLKEYYFSEDYKNDPLTIEYLAQLKKEPFVYNTKNKYKELPFKKFKNKFKRIYNLNIINIHNNYILQTDSYENNINTSESILNNNSGGLYKKQMENIKKLFYLKTPIVRENVSKNKPYNLFNNSIDEVVIIENIEVALLSILFFNKTSLIHKENLKAILEVIKKMIINKSFSSSLTTLINLDCFKAIMLDYGPTHPILNKNKFWELDLDWDKMYLYEIFEELETFYTSTNDMDNIYEWNELPWKEDKVIIAIHNIINNLVSTFEVLDYISNKIINQPYEIRQLNKEYLRKLKNQKTKKEYQNTLIFSSNFVNNNKISSSSLLSYNKKLTTSFLFTLRSTYPTNIYYKNILKANEHRLEHAKETQKKLLSVLRQKKVTSHFIQTLEKQYKLFKEDDFSDSYIEYIYKNILFKGNKLTTGSDLEGIKVNLYYLTQYIKFFEGHQEIINNILFLWKSTKNQLVNNYLNVVIVAARDEHYSNRQTQLVELIQEGYIALMASVDQFESDLGYSFSTYCTFWIHQAIQRNSSILLNSSKVFPDKKNTNAHRLISTDVPMFTNPHNIVSDYIEDPLNTSNQEIEDSQLNILKETVKILPPSIKTLIYMRYGIYPFKKHTLEEVGNIFSVNGETIRYIIRIALKQFQEINKSTDTHLNEWLKQIKEDTF